MLVSASNCDGVIALTKGENHRGNRKANREHKLAPTAKADSYKGSSRLNLFLQLISQALEFFHRRAWCSFKSLKTNPVQAKPVLVAF